MEATTWRLYADPHPVEADLLLCGPWGEKSNETLPFVRDMQSIPRALGTGILGMATPVHTIHAVRSTAVRRRDADGEGAHLV